MENREVITKYIEAFNDKDIEGCFKYLSDDLIVLKLPNEELHLASKKAAKEHYKQSIGDGSFLPITIISEIILGQYVTLLIDKNDGESSRKTTVINYLEDGLIKKMWIAPDNNLN